MNEILSSKCPSCGNSMVFNPESQTLKCEHCGGQQVIRNLTNVVKKEFNAQSRVQKSLNASVTHECDRCGAKTNINEQQVSGVCPYCGSSSLHELSKSIEFKPDAVVPFKISKKQARENYKAWIKSRKFVPNKLKSGAKINKMEGVYFPCWNFDFDVATSYSGVGINNHTRTIHRRGPNGQTIVDHEHYTTRHPFSGNRADSFTDFTQVAGNQHISGYEFLKLGRFGVNENLMVYNPAYLLGFVSSAFTDNLQTGYSNAKARAEGEIKDRIMNNHSYDSYSSFSMNCNHTNIRWNYIYLPVWICNFKFAKKEYRFLVNGYTGYVNGKVPRSGWKIFSLVAGIILGVSAVVLGIIGLNSGWFV